MGLSNLSILNAAMINWYMVGFRVEGDKDKGFFHVN
jgi:hypothetical protein